MTIASFVNDAPIPIVVHCRFIDKNQLDQMYLDEIAQFIIKNSKAPTLTAGGAQRQQDPFTGQSAYVPYSRGTTASASGYVDPFTGANSYKTEQFEVGDGSHEN